MFASPISAQSFHAAAPTPVRSPHQWTPGRRRDLQDRHRIKTRPCKAARDGVERHRSGTLNLVRFSLSTHPHLTANNPTQCCICELYLRGRSQQPVVDFAKTFERRKFNHKEAILGDVCFASVVRMCDKKNALVDRACRWPGDTNKPRYVTATLSQSLGLQLHLVPGVPTIHINRAV